MIKEETHYIKDMKEIDNKAPSIYDDSFNIKNNENYIYD